MRRKNERRTAARDTKKYPELAKSHKPRTPWRWVKDSSGEKNALKVLIKPIKANT